MDYDIPGYLIHSIKLDNNTGRGIAIYSKDALDKSVIQIDSDPSFEEVCLIEVRQGRGDILLFGCVYRGPTSSESSKQNNDKLNSLLKSISSKKYTHRCIVGDFNFRHLIGRHGVSLAAKTVPRENLSKPYVIHTNMWHKQLGDETLMTHHCST